MIHYTCPVCAYPDMKRPVEEGNLCPCCGTEFGYDDGVLEQSHREIRDKWVADGAEWFSNTTAPPYRFDGIIQLTLAGFEFDFPYDDDTEGAWQSVSVCGTPYAGMLAKIGSGE